MDALRTSRHCRGAMAVIWILAGWSLPAWADEQTPGNETEELIDLSLEELLQVEVTTLSRKPQLLSDTPAAMYVISQSDIARSGARTIPDVLRMVPGLQIAQVESSSWAVTSRGSNGVFANKLLVLMDGRTLYSPMFSGVYWDTRDTDLASIDRIEVIRGPGATMWGSNAVNGVINIITKRAEDTQGGELDAIAGTERVEGQVRYGDQVGNAHYRAYLKWFDRDGFSDLPGGGAADDWDMLRGGVRIDWSDQGKNELTFASEIYSGDIGENLLTTSPLPPYNQFNAANQDVSGAFASVGWGHEISSTSRFQLNMYYDYTDISKIAPEESRDTIDIDIQHQFKPLSRHDVVWGLGYRRSDDDTTGSFTISLDPESRTQRILSAFIQDEIGLNGDDLFLTIGTKVEKNNFSTNTLEWEPNIRLSWLATEEQTLWTSVARAVRTPSRVEQNGTINGAVLPPGTPPAFSPLPTALTITGNSNLETEDVTAYEAGYRFKPNDALQLDLAVFYNKYENSRVTSAPQAPLCEPGGVAVAVDPTCVFTATYLSLPVLMINGEDVDTQGVELNVAYKATESWWLQGAYTYLHIDDDQAVAVSSVGADSPEHQFSLRSSWNVTEATELDLWLRYVDELTAQNIDSYVTMDARYMWTPIDALEIGLVGRNLLQDEHAEFVEEFGASIPVQIPREVYAELIWHF
jgi:iron complex outermembrane receptor protein